MLTKHRNDNVRVSHRGCVTTNAWPRQSSERLAQKLDDSHDESAQRLAKIRQRLGFLCHDLRTFSANTHAAERLNSSVHAHFLGPPYLSPEDALYVQAYDVAILRSPEAAPDSESSGSGPRKRTLAQFLERGIDVLVETRRAKGEAARDFVMCTSHDLAPLLQEACGFPKQYFETRAFKDAYQRWEKEVRKAAKKGRGAPGPV